MNNKLSHRRVTGLSGNEIFCLHRLGLRPGQLCIGNSVVALGLGRGLRAGLSTLGGGEVTQVTRLVHDGRKNAFARLEQEARHDGGVGITGVSIELVRHGTNLEFITQGSSIHGDDPTATLFSCAAGAQQLYCQRDAGFMPLGFVFGNVAYSIGVGGGIGGRLRALLRGEVPEFSNIFDRTRHLALERITEEARQRGANAVIGIATTIAPLLGTQEMVMVGTASHHPLLPERPEEPVTSGMTNEEMWNLMYLGYMPVRLVMGVSVYALGLGSGLMAGIRSLWGGEVKGMTELLYEAREKALARIEAEAERCGADAVVGVKTRVYHLGGGLVEFMALGTAVRKMPGAKTHTDNLPAQAIIVEREMFVDQGGVYGRLGLGAGSVDSAQKTQRGPLTLFFSALVFFFYAWMSWKINP